MSKAKIILIAGTVIIGGAGFYIWWKKKKQTQAAPPATASSQSPPFSQSTSAAPPNNTSPVIQPSNTTAPTNYVPPTASGSIVSGPIPVNVLETVSRDLFCHPPSQGIFNRLAYQAQIANGVYEKSGINMDRNTFLGAFMQQMNCNG